MLVITELILTTLFDRVLMVRYPMLLRAFVLTYKSSPHKPFGNTDSLLLIHRYKLPVSSIIATIVSGQQSGIYGFLLSTQGTSCIKPRGSPRSSPLRSDGSQDDQAEEAGPVEQSSAEAKNLKLRAKGLSGYHPQWATTEEARWRARGPNKGLLA